MEVLVYEAVGGEVYQAAIEVVIAREAEPVVVKIQKTVNGVQKLKKLCTVKTIVFGPACKNYGTRLGKKG